MGWKKENATEMKSKVAGNEKRKVDRKGCKELLVGWNQKIKKLWEDPYRKVRVAPNGNKIFHQTI